MLPRARLAVAVIAVTAGCGGFASLAGAAPLDALLDLGDDPKAPTRWTVEAVGDVTQALFDAARIDRRAGQTTAARLHLTSGPWSFELGGHQRALHDKSNDYRVQSWHSAVQFEPGDTTAADALRWGVRLGAWGNRSDHLLQSTNASLKVSGLKARLTEMELVQPRDLQWQLDLIGRARLADPRWTLSGFAGVGTSAVTRSVVSGKATISGCTYQLQFGDERLNALPMPDCPKALIVSVPNTLLAVDVLEETRYRSVYGHAGAAVHWTVAPWRLALGGELQQWQRTGATERQTRNALLVSEAAHAFDPALSVVVRGQYMHRQLLGEVPMLYNARSTASTRRVVSVSVGLQAKF
ncbi:hypothetical protein [Sphaerotilus sp.]|uniref:hypothetical protein n=1 Tax=Sphaerotilus sp. TaxID=2093942 RepID=UPI00286E192B|nr:hypothetical protein [Sphaerotilus sp.]